MEALKRIERGEIEKCEGMFLYLSLGNDELRITPGALTRTDWGFVFKAEGETRDILRELFDINSGEK